MQLFKQMLLLSTVFFFTKPCFSQTARTHQEGAFLVRLKPMSCPDSLISQMELQLGKQRVFLSFKALKPFQNYYLLTTDHHVVAEQNVLAALSASPLVDAAQFNHLVTPRNHTEPNDPGFINQWHFQNDGNDGGIWDVDLNAPEAWEYGTGGITPLGDTIVICMLDSGIDPSHPDLMHNLWKNSSEIPSDGLDNDNNGYVDDYAGWNTFYNNDNIGGLYTGHGTPVAGIIGAEGNNNLGITGINWQVKIMTIVCGGTEADLIAGYGYALKARQEYNESNGTKGAYVVATNLSWGIDGGNPMDAPLWCAIYDSLGSRGILNCAATSNANVNVDVFGDLPTACTSDYLVTVTSLDKFGQKVEHAGWGKNSIDIGAYGKEIFSTASGGTYSLFSGTSFASPQAAGAVGLLYAAPCPDLAVLSHSNPGSSALWAKELLLQSGQTNASLFDKTATGKSLRLDQLMEHYDQQCSSCPAPFLPSIASTTPTEAVLSCALLPTHTLVEIRWHRVGAPNWNLDSFTADQFNFTALESCTAYEFQLRGHCGAEIGVWSDIATFSTLGCCEAPHDLFFTEVTENAIHTEWTPNIFTDSLALYYRSETGSWENLPTTAPHAGTLSNCLPCTQYQFKLQANCADGSIHTALANAVRTKGCGTCSELTYCSSHALLTAFEWIEQVEIGDWTMQPPTHNGYESLVNTENPPCVVIAGNTHPVQLTPGFSGLNYPEYFKIYADFNRDGDFDDLNELAFDPGFACPCAITGSLAIPANAATGITRFRVMMQYADGLTPLSDQCSVYEFGQTVDFCAWISPGGDCPVPQNQQGFWLGNELNLQWENAGFTGQYEVNYHRTDAVEEQRLLCWANDIKLADLDPAAAYEWRVRSICADASISAWSEQLIIDPANTPVNAAPSEDISAISVFPNPFFETFSITHVGQAEITGLALVDQQGRTLWTAVHPTLGPFNPGKLAPGLYYLKIKTAKSVHTIKIAVANPEQH